MTQNWIGQVNVNTEDGSDLVGRLNNFDTAHKTNQAGATRPTGISGGGLWSKDNGGGSFTLMLFDGSTDIPLTSLPGSLAAGDMFYWNGTALVRIPAGTDGQTLIYDASLTKPKWGAAGGGMTTIGTQATTSGKTVTLSGLTLTGYKSLQIIFDDIRVGNVVTSGASPIKINGVPIDTLANRAAFDGMVTIDLVSGVHAGSIRNTDVTGSPSTVAAVAGASSISTASSEVSLTSSGNAFSGGQFIVQGVK